MASRQFHDRPKVHRRPRSTTDVHRGPATSNVVMLDNDDTVLYVTADACGWELRVAEVAGRVVMQPRGLGEIGLHCNSVRTAQLSRPLGTRVVVGARTGFRVPVETPPNP